MPSGGVSTKFNVILASSDDRLFLLPYDGINLFDCMRNIPGMTSALAMFGVESNVVRGRIELVIHQKDNLCRYKVVIHPGNAEVMDTFMGNFFFHPGDALERLEFREMPSGGIIQWSDTLETTMRLRLPNGTMWTADEVRFWPCEQPLNEFGFMYVALYIVGNYARYFPDLWMRDVERNSPLALAVEELLAMMARRMPLLSLSELSRIYFVPAA